MRGDWEVQAEVTELESATGDELLANPDRLLTSAEVAALLGMTPDTWRSLKRPEPDVPELERPANLRQPKWKLKTIVAWNATRPRRKRKAADS